MCAKCVNMCVCMFVMRSVGDRVKDVCNQLMQVLRTELWSSSRIDLPLYTEPSFKPNFYSCC